LRRKTSATAGRPGNTWEMTKGQGLEKKDNPGRANPRREKRGGRGNEKKEGASTDKPSVMQRWLSV